MNLIQRVAQAVHLQWSLWQEYQDKHGSKTLGLSPYNEHFVSFTQEQWEEWNRKANTRYQDLSIEEQKSDIVIAEKIWVPLLKEWLNKKYKAYYDPHEEFVCPPAVTIDGLIRELEAETNNDKPTEK